MRKSRSKLLFCSSFWKKTVPFAVGIAFLFAIAVLSFGNPQWNKWIYIFQAYVFPGKGTLYINDDDYTGVLCYWWTNGQLQREAEYLSGLQHGKETQWYENGQIKCKRMYKNGDKAGKEVEWYANGQKKAERQYEDDYECGIGIEWYPDGRMEKISGYSINGYIYISTSWNSYVIGSKELEIKSEEFIDEKRMLKVKAVWYNNKLSSINTWDMHGKPRRYLTYYKNMKIREESIYREGLLEGFKSKWHDSGKKREITSYHKDKRNGKQLKWDEMGWLWQFAHYKNDKKHGPLVRLYKDGEVRSEYYINGKEVSLKQYQLVRKNDSTLLEWPSRETYKRILEESAVLYKTVPAPSPYEKDLPLFRDPKRLVPTPASKAAILPEVESD